MKARTLKTFTGYPNGSKTTFTAGEEITITKAYCDEAKLIEQGLVEPLPDQDQPEQSE